MQFLADENFSFQSISLLITPGFQVRKAAIVYRGKPDIFLLQEANLNKEILRFNKDFHSFVTSPIDQIINKRSTIWNALCLTLIDEHKMRQRPIF